MSLRRYGIRGWRLLFVVFALIPWLASTPSAWAGFIDPETCAEVTTFEENANWLRTLHISPSGNDSNGDGSPEKPFKTLDKAAKAARPGDIIRVGAGTYSGRVYINNLHGTAENPIKIVGPDTGEAIFDGSNEALHMTDVTYLILRNLTFTGGRDNAINCDDGGSYETPSTHLIFDNLRIHDYGSGGNNDGIKLSGVDHFYIMNCDIFNGSSGGSDIDLVGCHHGYIINNRIYGDASGSSSNFIQVKGGSRNVVVHGNHLSGKRGRGVNIGGSTGTKYFRPSLDTGIDYEAKDVRVTGNIIVGADEGAVTFVGSQDCVAEHNVIISPKYFITRILRETDVAPTANGIFANNIIMFNVDGGYPKFVNIGKNTSPETFTFKNNLWYCANNANFNYNSSQADMPGTVSGNIFGQGDINDPLFQGASAENFRLKEGSPAIGAADSVGVRADFEGNCDINDIGAFKYAGAKKKPVADFTSDVNQGLAPLTVRFTDTSDNDPTAWEWDFNDDGHIDATIPSPEYEYLSEGVYTVTLTAKNDAGSDTRTRQDFIIIDAPASFLLSFLAGDHGAVTGDTDQSVADGGDAAPVTAVPDDGYHFAGWTGDYQGSENPLTLTGISADMTITAVFEADAPQEYAITFTCGTNGSLSGPANQTVKRGENAAAITAVPAGGYHFAGWTGDFTGDDNPLTLQNVQSDMNLFANFEKDPVQNYSVSFFASQYGSISGQLNQTVESGKDTTAVAAAADPGYHFTGWTGDYNGADNPLVLKGVTRDMIITANFEKDAVPEYAISFSAGANGSITGSKSQLVKQGANAAPVTAVPANGYHFTGWTGDYTGSDNPLVLTNVTKAMTVTANFEKDAVTEYAVNFSAGANGSLNGPANQTVKQGENAAPVTAVPADGYHFTGWTGDYTGSDNPLVLTNVTKAMSVAANFEKDAVPEYAVNFSASANGSINGPANQTVKQGENAAPVTAVAADGHHFTGWTGDYTGSENPLTLTNVTKAMSVTANFERYEYNVTFSASDNGSINDPANQKVKHGEDAAAVTAVPADGYHFAGWTGDYTGDDNPLTLKNVTKAMAVTANFEKDAVPEFTVKFTAGGPGTLSGPVNQTVKQGDNAAPVTAVPAGGYHFAGWTGDATGMTNPLTLQNVQADMTVSAIFEKDAVPTYTVTFVAGPNGSVSGQVNQTVEAGQSTTAVAATANPGYHFTGWTGDDNGTDNPLVLNGVTRAMTVTANFEKDVIPPVIVTFVAGPNGTISGVTSQTVEVGASTSPVTATANPGYHFTGWTGGFTGDANPLILQNVQADMTVTANFEMDAVPTFTVTFVAGPNGAISGATQHVVTEGGATTAVAAEPADGYLFAGWTGDYTGAENPLTIIGVDRDMVITADFAPIHYVINASAQGDGEISPPGEVSVAHGQKRSFSIQPGAGSRIADVIVDGESVGTPESYTFETVTEPHTIEAVFEAEPTDDGGNEGGSDDGGDSGSGGLGGCFIDAM